MSEAFSTLSKIGFVYTFQHFDEDMHLVDEWSEHNLVPTEGMNYILNAALAGGSASSTWYIGLFSGNYTPVIGDTMATFPGNATEFTGYTNSTRGTLTAGAVASGAWSNTASPFDFTFNASGTIYGAFLSSVSTKSATTGTLLSATRFAASKTVGSGEILRVTAGITLSN